MSAGDPVSGSEHDFGCPVAPICANTAIGATAARTGRSESGEGVRSDPALL